MMKEIRSALIKGTNSRRVALLWICGLYKLTGSVGEVFVHIPLAACEEYCDELPFLDDSTKYTCKSEGCYQLEVDCLKILSHTKHQIACKIGRSLRLSGYPAIASSEAGVYLCAGEEELAFKKVVASRAGGISSSVKACKKCCDLVAVSDLKVDDISLRKCRKSCSVEGGAIVTDNKPKKSFDAGVVFPFLFTEEQDLSLDVFHLNENRRNLQDTVYSKNASDDILITLVIIAGVFCCAGGLFIWLVRKIRQRHSLKRDLIFHNCSRSLSQPSIARFPHFQRFTNRSCSNDLEELSKMTELQSPNRTPRYEFDVSVGNSENYGMMTKGMQAPALHRLSGISNLRVDPELEADEFPTENKLRIPSMEERIPSKRTSTSNGFKSILESVANNFQRGAWGIRGRSSTISDCFSGPEAEIHLRRKRFLRNKPTEVESINHYI